MRSRTCAGLRRCRRSRPRPPGRLPCGEWHPRRGEPARWVRRSGGAFAATAGACRRAGGARRPRARRRRCAAARGGGRACQCRPGRQGGAAGCGRSHPCPPGPADSHGDSTPAGGRPRCRVKIAAPRVSNAGRIQIRGLGPGAGERWIAWVVRGIVRCSRPNNGAPRGQPGGPFTICARSPVRTNEPRRNRRISGLSTRLPWACSPPEASGPPGDLPSICTDDDPAGLN